MLLTGKTHFIINENQIEEIKSRLHTLFAHAKRHELCDKNPIEDVRQGSKRVRKPATLALDEVRGSCIK